MESGTGDAAPQAAVVPSPRGELVVVMSAKGGCGATIVACNLAHYLAVSARVCLLDLDVGCGDVAGVLDLRSGRSINIVLDQLAGGDEALLLGAADVLPGGLHVLAQPFELEELRELKAEEARALLELARRSFQAVLVDVGASIHVGALAAFESADRVLLVTTPDVPSLRDALRKLRLLRRIGISQDRIRLVLNKVSPDEPVSPAEVAEQLGVEVAARLVRDDAACARADTHGHLLERTAPRSQLTHQLSTLWQTLQAPPAVAAQPPVAGLWRRRTS